MAAEFKARCRPSCGRIASIQLDVRHTTSALLRCCHSMSMRMRARESCAPAFQITAPSNIITLTSSPTATLPCPWLQHDQAVGAHHGAEHARALVAGGSDLQRAVWRGADDAALVFGAAWFFADGFKTFGLEQRWRADVCSPSCAAGQGAQRPEKSPSRPPGCRAGQTAGLAGWPQRLRHHGARIRPTAIGRPGRMAIFQKATSPSFFIMALV